MHRHFIAAAAVFALFAMALMGAGCERAGSANAQTNLQLKQPAPAAAPTKAPEIPPEAAKVPRPY